jgi:hypothetical protein
MNEEAYEYMSRKDVLWCCKICSKTVRKIMHEKPNVENQGTAHKEIMDKMAAMENGLCKIEKMEGKFDTLSKAMDLRMKQMEDVLTDCELSVRTAVTNPATTEEPTWASKLRTCIETTNAPSNLASSRQPEPAANIKTMLKETMDEKERESTDRLKRIPNVVIYRAPEEQGNDKGKQDRADKQLIAKLLNEIGCDEIDFSEATRLGKKENNDSIRPLRFTVQNEDAKSTIMSSLKNLKDASEELKQRTVTHDLTQAQREERKAMLAELETKEVEEGYRFTVRSHPGPRWDPKITKIKIKK